MDSNNEKMGLVRIIKNVLRLMKDHKLKFFLTGICAVISVLFTIISPLLLGDAINILIEGAGNIINHTGTIDFDRLCYLLFITATLYFLSNLFSYIQTYYLTKTTSEIIYSLRQRMMNKAIQMPMEDVDENKIGDVLSRLTNDIDVLQVGLAASFLEITTTLIKIIGTLIMMIIINAGLTLAIVAVVLLSSALIGVVVKFSQKYFEKQLFIQGNTSGQIEEIFSSQEVIRTLNSRH